MEFIVFILCLRYKVDVSNYVCEINDNIHLFVLAFF